MKIWIYASALFAVTVGALLPWQVLINARLGAMTHGPLYAAFVSFLIGTVVLLLALLVTRTPLWPAQPLAALPPWIWFGGAIGAVFVFAATLLVPKLGAAGMICLVVFGQVSASLLLDHYGVLGAVRAADPSRVLGVALVAVGALLVVRPWQQAS